MEHDQLMNRRQFLSVSDALVSSVDIPPTLLELAGQPVPWKMQGDSMAEWFRGGRGPSNAGVFIALSNWQAVWDGRYVYCPSSKYEILYDHVVAEMGSPVRA